MAQPLPLGPDGLAGPGAARRPHGFTVQEMAPVIDGGRPVSSTRIRGLLADGDVGEAAHLLGRYYELAGEVVGGAQRR